LSEIWRPDDIPIAFVGPTKRAPSSSTPLPSCLSAKTTNTTLPLKIFVHEVLKRSQTSGSILQTALCYLEAVCSKIPDISHDEKHGIRMLESMILPATKAELSVASDYIVKMICQSDQSADTTDFPPGFNGLDVASSVCVDPALSAVVSTSLPSPLLCPRRTFLASLILASKFSQDKCYSNRAWAKLSGLPPREIGRCERTLGQALDWRLWVGKKMTLSEPTTSAATSLAVPVRTGLAGDSLLLPKVLHFLWIFLVALY